MTSRLSECLECGTVHGRKGVFCGDPCRQAFNNRRLQRGAEFYDLYMAHRFERAVATELGLMQAINRLASNFREEDKRDRAGRRSWRKPRVVLDERPYLKAITTYDGTGRRARA